MMVVTRTQAMRQLQEEITTRSEEHKSGAKPHGISEVSEESACIGSEFDSEMFSSSREKFIKPDGRRESCVNSIMGLPSKT